MLRIAMMIAALAAGSAAMAQESADDELNRYWKAAIERIEGEERADTMTQLRASQRAWIRFRNEECEAVAAWWRPGAIASTMEGECLDRLTRVRTKTIWEAWLTYKDSTPPILPRPAGE